MGWTTLIRREGRLPVGSLALRPSRTATRLGAGLIRCREEDAAAATCTPTSETMNAIQVQLEHCRARDAHSLTQLTHGAASTLVSTLSFLAEIRCIRTYTTMAALYVRVRCLIPLPDIQT